MQPALVDFHVTTGNSPAMFPDFAAFIVIVQEREDAIVYQANMGRIRAFCCFADCRIDYTVIERPLHDEWP
jgi:hypothetical protein